MADQIAAASQAISLIPPFPDDQFRIISARLDAIEKAQEGLREEIRVLRERVDSDTSTKASTSANTNATSSAEELKKAIEEQVANFKLEYVSSFKSFLLYDSDF